MILDYHPFSMIAWSFIMVVGTIVHSEDNANNNSNNNTDYDDYDNKPSTIFPIQNKQDDLWTISINQVEEKEEFDPSIINSKFLILNIINNNNNSLQDLKSGIFSHRSSLNRLPLKEMSFKKKGKENDSNNNQSLSNMDTLTLKTNGTAIEIDFPSNQNATSSINNNVSGVIITKATTNEPDIEYIQFRDNTRFWVQRVLVPIIMIIGIIGNSITIIIMTRRRMRSSTNWYLAALATFDMIYLIFTFILSLKHYPNAHSNDYRYYWYMFPWSTMITDAASNTSVWLTVTFTIERYIAVCHPIRGKVICTESRAKKVIICVFIICLSVTLPTPFEWVVIKRTINNQEIYWEAVFSELGKNETYKNIYYHLTVFLFVLLPLILLVIFNSFLIRSVHISNKLRSQMVMGKDKIRKSSNSNTIIGNNSVAANVPSTNIENTSTTIPSHSSSSRQEIRITVMLIAVVILFIICQTPTACILVYTAFNQLDPQSNQMCLLVGLSNIFNLLMSINSAGNFVLYCLLSQKYRRTFVQMFCPCLSNRYGTRQNLDYSVATKNATIANNFNYRHQHHGGRHHHHRASDENGNQKSIKNNLHFNQSFLPSETITTITTPSICKGDSKNKLNHNNNNLNLNDEDNDDDIDSDNCSKTTIGKNYLHPKQSSKQPLDYLKPKISEEKERFNQSDGEESSPSSISRSQNFSSIRERSNSNYSDD